MGLRTCCGFAVQQILDRSRQWTLGSGPDLSVWRPWARPLLEARVVGCWCGCLSGARCRQLYDLLKLYDLHAIFLFQIIIVMFYYAIMAASTHTYSQYISFKKYFYVSLGNNFLMFLWRPLGNCPVCPPPLKSGPNWALLYYVELAVSSIVGWVTVFV